jgi:UDP-N-acetylglucosamine 2-epimerase
MAERPSKPRVLFVVGTRPDAIKSAPVILEFRKQGLSDVVVVSTGQHREMLDQALAAFGLSADVDLAIMRHGQNLAHVTTRALEGLHEQMVALAPDFVMAQGDTTTTFCAGLAAFYLRIPFGHIEAGLRTESVSNPFPEEFNRRATSLTANLHFAPTQWAANNLSAEGKNPSTIFVTGNTGIDAVLQVAESSPQTWYLDSDERIVLLTTHRRENWGEPQRRIALAALEIVDSFPKIRLVVPMHKNPQVRETLKSVFGGHQRIDLIEPPDYPDFVKLMERSELVLTDSGGVQEEAPTFGKPILVLRESTERPEGIEAGSAILVGCDHLKIVSEAKRLLNSKPDYDAMAKCASPYGDGRASRRIRSVVHRFLGMDEPLEAMWT